MGKKEAKTNAIRILETMKIPYEARTYECDDFVDAAQIADKLGLDHAGMYKTITTVGKSGGYYVFVVPIDDEIDFKKAAKAAGEKSIEMLHLKDLTKVTGYIRGGCTSIGMKNSILHLSMRQLRSRTKSRSAEAGLDFRLRCHRMICAGRQRQSMQIL